MTRFNPKVNIMVTSNLKLKRFVLTFLTEHTKCGSPKNATDTWLKFISSLKYCNSFSFFYYGILMPLSLLITLIYSTVLIAKKSINP